MSLARPFVLVLVGTACSAAPGPEVHSRGRPTPTDADEATTNGTWVVLDAPEKAEGTLAFTGARAVWTPRGDRTPVAFTVSARRGPRVDLAPQGETPHGDLTALWAGPNAAWLWASGSKSRGWLLLRSQPVPSMLIGTWNVEQVIEGSPLPPTLVVSVAEIGWKKAGVEERYKILGTYEWENTITIVGNRKSGGNILAFRMLGPDSAVVFEPDEFNEFMVAYRSDDLPSWMKPEPTMDPEEGNGDQVL